MTSTIISGIERGSSNSSSAPPKALVLALAIAMAGSALNPHIQESPDLRIQTNSHDGVLQISSIGTKASLEAQWARLRSRLAAFKEYRLNWNGEGGVAPNPEHVEAILQALARLPIDMSIPKPMLSDDGEVGVYWSSGNAFADLTIDSLGEMSLYLRSLDEEGGVLKVLPSPDAIDERVIHELSQHLA